ncbi:MAG: septum site-determining protein MinC [Oceanobacter sp.]
MTTDDLTLKTSLLPLSTLTLGNTSAEALTAKLAEKRAAAPGLFSRFPCILALPERTKTTLSLSDIRQICEEHGILIIGVSGHLAGWEAEITRHHLADFSDTAQLPGKTEAPQKEPELPEEPAERALKIHQGNVRSGQQLYSQGDLILMGNVSAGAELIAAGDVHVYGHIRGRVLAGTPDNKSAVISCQHFDAELVSIGGTYQLFDTQECQQHQGDTLIQLQENRLTYTHHQ